MSLTMTTISAGDPLVSQVQSLYETAFPKAERVQFDVLLNKQRPGYTTHLYAFNDDETFIGLATTIARDGLHLLGYFAIDESLRGKGYGSQAITLLKDACLPETLALEIETPDPAAPNAA
ncbi:GNAT family N-acetyltransferase [Lacticaseibacillus yichunensis]|uniref:GNAT family N-acetyltransferase n=1 Tax=Lacticaseibacillus yichunensis TaxID=2486015 RepID=A0ABW4CNT1_9LACO|nr:GNAT family N-acetyltransferase [Lacticaseibacillus yichunensis]